MMITLFVVQKCWLDGPNYEHPVDCWRLWTTAEAASQFAHASALRYTEIEHTRNPRNTKLVVRTLLLNSQFGFATSGWLFWVRAVQTPLCGHLEIPTTALARLYQGILGATSTVGRRGTEDLTNSVRLDCPSNCLQGWLSEQLRTYSSCSWRRIPVGDAHSNADWWKEWSDSEAWACTRSTSNCKSNGLGAVVASTEINILHDENVSTCGAKRRMKEAPSFDLDDDVHMDSTMIIVAGQEGMIPSATTRGRCVTDENTNSGFLFSEECYGPNKRPVASQPY